jgi:uncharacterized LabA/DUF88 family protein
MKRAGFYFDGFNVYHSVDDRLPAHCKWADYKKLAEQLLADDEHAEVVKLFTAYPEWKPAKVARHRIFVKAQEYVGVDVVLGKFKGWDMSCKACGAVWQKHEEKESDVNIAIHIISDVLLGKVDTIYLVTADSDLGPVAQMVKAVNPNVRIVSVAPVGMRHPRSIRAHADFVLNLTEGIFKNARLPEVITTPSGHTITCPAEYAKP